jgi:hypothetical protein
MIIDRLKKYLSSREFNYCMKYSAFDLPGSFVARNNILMLHIWMINERLRVIAYEILKDIDGYTWWQRVINADIRNEVSSAKKLLKMISYINEKLMQMFERQTDKSLYLIKIHPAQRKKIKSICEKQAEQVSYLLYKHFDKENKGYKDLDTLMQSIFYPHKMQSQNFSNFIFQIGEYTMKHREYLSKLTIDDIKNSDIDWDVMRIDPNVVKIMKKARQGEEPVYPPSPLDEQDLQIIETLETILPEERRQKSARVTSTIVDEKYKPINVPKI